MDCAIADSFRLVSYDFATCPRLEVKTNVSSSSMPNTASLLRLGALHLDFHKNIPSDPVDVWIAKLSSQSATTRLSKIRRYPLSVNFVGVQ